MRDGFDTWRERIAGYAQGIFFLVVFYVAGRNKRKDAHLQSVKERAERAGWRLHPHAQEIRANPAHTGGCIVEVHEGNEWTVYRYTGSNF